MKLKSNLTQSKEEARKQLSQHTEHHILLIMLSSHFRSLQKKNQSQGDWGGEERREMEVWV